MSIPYYPYYYQQYQYQKSEQVKRQSNNLLDLQGQCQKDPHIEQQKNESFSNNSQINEIEDKKQLTCKLINEVMCIICLQTSDQFYTTSCCQQYLCIQCNKQTQKCPTCQQKCQLINNKCVQRILDFIICQCIYKNCNFHSSFLEVIKHQKYCKFQTRSCNICKQHYLEKDIFDHLLSDHKLNVLEQLTEKIEKNY
ncbi:hypothetical protein ABPG72_011314 [Tetrahymena utriculariae]